ncbi:hypothetical protein J6590_005830 [Homalodisca vitripennis]|nr:hypothetical protein J6590_005830 [Homalodisca vitripennis]
MSSKWYLVLGTFLLIWSMTRLNIAGAVLILKNNLFILSVTGVTSALTELLVLELRCKLADGSAYCCPYNTRSPLHPLVAVLKRRPLAWHDVLNQLSTLCSHSDNQVVSNSLELVRPVLVYVLMEGNDLPDSCRLQAFKIVISHFSDTDFLIEALASCLNGLSSNHVVSCLLMLCVPSPLAASGSRLRNLGPGRKASLQRWSNDVSALVVSWDQLLYAVVKEACRHTGQPLLHRRFYFFIIGMTLPRQMHLQVQKQMCWNNNRLLEVVQLVSALGEAAVASKHGLHVSLSCLALATLVPRLLQTAVCPQPTLQLVARLAAIATNTHSTLLALLADSIPSCPAPHLQHLLAFFVELLGRGQCSLDCTWMCVSALMPWLAASPSHLHQALHTASLIVNHASAATANASTTATLIGNSAVAAVVSADPRLTQAIHLARLSEILRTDSSATLQWLKSAQVIRMDQIHQYVSALLISRAETEVKLAALEALVCSQAPMATSHNLTLMLYQLAKEKQPEVQLALLRALPSTAVEKNNVLGVISTLEALRQSGNQQLSLLAVELYCQLWLNQERCYPQLMGVLDQNCENYPWLANLLQANICKIICDTRPEMHGKEVVPKVSDILNKCGGVKDSAASTLALEALIPLCCHDVVDIFTIWRSLAPRFSRDKRPPVIKRFVLCADNNGFDLLEFMVRLHMNKPFYSPALFIKTSSAAPLVQLSNADLIIRRDSIDNAPTH